jgi:hypothetical protein
VGLLLTIFEGVAKGIKRKRLANHSV